MVLECHYRVKRYKQNTENYFYAVMSLSVFLLIPALLIPTVMIFHDFTWEKAMGLLVLFFILFSFFSFVFPYGKGYISLSNEKLQFIPQWSPVGFIIIPRTKVEFTLINKVRIIYNKYLNYLSIGYHDKGKDTSRILILTGLKSKTQKLFISKFQRDKRIIFMTE